MGPTPNIYSSPLILSSYHQEMKKEEQAKPSDDEATLNEASVQEVNLEEAEKQKSP